MPFQTECGIEDAHCLTITTMVLEPFTWGSSLSIDAFDLGGVKLEPFVGASVMRLHLDGFQEEGGAAALTGYGRTYDLGTTTLGLRAEAKLGVDLPLTVHGLVGSGGMPLAT